MSLLSIFRPLLNTYAVSVAVDAPDTINGQLHYEFDVTTTSAKRARTVAMASVTAEHLNYRRHILGAVAVKR